MTLSKAIREPFLKATNISIDTKEIIVRYEHLATDVKI
jgi:hypothetical protein